MERRRLDGVFLCPEADGFSYRHEIRPYQEILEYCQNILN